MCQYAAKAGFGAGVDVDPGDLAIGDGEDTGVGRQADGFAGRGEILHAHRRQRQRAGLRARERMVGRVVRLPVGFRLTLMSAIAA